MPGQALPKHAKHAKQFNSHLQKLCAALCANKANCLKPAQFHHSCLDIAHKYGVSKDTLKYAAEGSISIATFNTSKQKMPALEEHVLIDHIKESSDCGFPLTHLSILQAANAIIVACPSGYTKKNLTPLTRQWVFCFFTHHNNELHSYWSQALDSQYG